MEMDVRWSILVLCLGLCTVVGCGRKTSTSKAYNHLTAAANALSAGDKETAFAELSASLETSPSAWAYFERARLYLDKGQEQEALADCQKGLELDAQYPDLLWLSAELKKPPAQRFKGKFAKPPGLR